MISEEIGMIETDDKCVGAKRPQREKLENDTTISKPADNEPVQISEKPFNEKQCLSSWRSSRYIAVPHHPIRSTHLLGSHHLVQSEIHDGFGPESAAPDTGMADVGFCTSVPASTAIHDPNYGPLTHRHVPRNALMTSEDLDNEVLCLEQKRRMIDDEHFNQFNQGFDSFMLSNQMMGGSGNLIDGNLLPEGSDTQSYCTEAKMKRKSAPTLATGRRSKDDTLPPDEHEKRQLRRERNKIAAAKCRRRRADLTRELEEKTSKLTNEKDALERQIMQLSEDKYKLETFIVAHQKACERFRNQLRNSAVLNEIASNINRRNYNVNVINTSDF